VSEQTVFVYVAGYAYESEARADYEVLEHLHSRGLIATYDAALVVKDRVGKVHGRRHEKSTEHGALTGVGVGAVLGILFPPSIIGSAIVGGAAGGLAGHLWRGMTRGDMKDLGETLDAGEGALVAVGRARLDEVLDRELWRAIRRTHKQVDADGTLFERELGITTA
jgi:uncharacterized membrane protein